MPTRTEDSVQIQEDHRQEAIEYVTQLKKFYKHLFSYITINIVLIIINLATDPHHIWFLWVTVFWGIGIFLQGTRAYFPVHKIFSKSWEEKKIKQYLSDKYEE